MRPRLLSLALLTLACAPAKQPWAAPRPEVLVDVLPRSAEIRINGALVGTGPTVLSLAAEPAAVEVLAPGFEKGAATLDPRLHAGGRVGVVLRPIAFGDGRRLDIDDAPGLTIAGAWLLRAGQAAEAAGYAERAVELAPSGAQARRVLGLSLERLGQKKRAAVELSQYLQLSPPDAPDREQIEAAVARLRGDIAFPERK